MSIETVLSRHERIALQLSGGRDSLACLYLVRPYLDRITVYWVNTGAAYPEMLEVIGKVREFIPNFVEIDGDQPGVIARHGIPTDILPRSATPIGLASTESTVLMQDSYSCCARVVMMPMHTRVIADGCTLIIRGQRDSDSHKAPLKSGTVEHGIEYLFPIESWSNDEVDAYLESQGVERLRFYETMGGAADCMTCSGWWSENHGQYLRTYHPESYVEYQRRLGLIADQAREHIALFNIEFQG